MLLVHAGNQVDAPGRTAPPRFPESQVEFVARRVRRFLAELRPQFVVTAAAAGADLIVIEAALAAAGIGVHVVLPFSADEFKRESVANRGPTWLERYDRVMAVIGERPDCAIVEHDESPTPDGYRRGNGHLLTHASGLAHAASILAVALRPPPDPASPSITDDFVDSALVRNIVTIDLDPSRSEHVMRRAFVAMPFGEKRVGRRIIDCDETFRKLIVPALEDADLVWQRADRETDSGLIHVGMIEQLANADVVVVDTVGDNPNVFYELGLRHAFAGRQTVIIGPRGAAPPFDTRPIRRFAYELPGRAIADADALRGVAMLRDVLTPPARDGKVWDSPVFAFFDLSKTTLIPRHDRESTRVLVDLHAAVSAAEAAPETAAAIDGLLALVAMVTEASIEVEDQRELLLRIGIALRRRGSYAQAIAVLRPLAFDEDDHQHELWAQHLAMSLRRRGEVGLEQGDDPEADWGEAQALLARLLERRESAESCGIAGGLAKRRGMLALRAGRAAVAVAHFDEAARYYRRGFSIDPINYYAGLNAITMTRIRAKLDGPVPVADGFDAAAAVPVTAFFARRDAELAGPGRAWAVLTVAELAYTAHVAGDSVGRDEVLNSYARAVALPLSRDEHAAANDQLDLYSLIDDPPEMLAQLRSLLDE